MQGGKSSSAVGAAREAAANVGASAWAGKEKTKAVVQGTVDKVAASDPEAKAAAETRKQQRVLEVESAKLDAMRHNAIVKEQGSAAAHHPSSAAPPPAGATGGGGGALLDREAAVAKTGPDGGAVEGGPEAGAAVQTPVAVTDGYGEVAPAGGKPAAPRCAQTVDGSTHLEA